MSTMADQYLTSTWNNVLSYLLNNKNVTQEVIDAFYRACSLFTLNTDKAVVVAPNIISKEIVRSQKELISSSLIDLLKLDHPITVEVCQKSELPLSCDLPNAAVQDYSEEFKGMSIQEDRTFENFVVGDCNRESQAAALACAINPGSFFNPLFIYGNSGLGKTHLLMAIGNSVLKNNPEKKVYYTDTTKFVETVANSIRDGRIDAFKQYMYGLDLLLIDDIQFLAGKEKSHEVFFTIFNELVNNHKQICIASDRQPKEIKGLEDRLISRFSSGLSVGIDSPEFETSLAILKMKIKNNGYGVNEVEDEGLNYIALNFSGNIRDLEGAWNRVLFYAIQFQPDGGCIRTQTVIDALKNQAVVSDRNGLSPKIIIKCVADYYGLTRQQITSKTRTKNIANARHISIYLCRMLLDLPYNRIGDEFGGRDHSTIISAYTKVEKQIKKDPAFSNVISDIKKQLID